MLPTPSELKDPELNLYAYVANDPLNLTDPTGNLGQLAASAASGAYNLIKSATDFAYNNPLTALTVLGTEIIGGGPEDPLADAAAAAEIAVTRKGLTAAEQLAANRAAGAAFEQATGTQLEQSGLTVGQQITVETQSGVRTRLDFLTQDPATGEIGCIECKASPSAPLTPNQKSAFPQIGQSGGTVVGAGKPGFPGGTIIPPTSVQVLRGP